MKKSELNIIQENVKQCVFLIENSFLKGIFTDSITDVSYNGNDLFIQDNYKGRYKYEKKVNEDDVYELIKLISNYMLKNFSVQNPILDVAFGNYRLSAVHPSIARFDNKKVTTFSLRKISPTLKIKGNEKYLAPPVVLKLLELLIKSHESIIISGNTGSGKTELQKYLVGYTYENERIILIEESYETYLKEIYPERDITSWIMSNTENDLSTLIKLALRNNPDWIIIAETRGKEAFDMINSILTGHPIITTLHSENAQNNLTRLIQMCKKSVEFDEKNMVNTIAKNLKIGVHVEKIFDNETNKYQRRISEVVEYVPYASSYKVVSLYNVYKNQYKKLSIRLMNKLKKNFFNLDEISIFGGTDEK